MGESHGLITTLIFLIFLKWNS